MADATSVVAALSEALHHHIPAAQHHHSNGSSSSSSNKQFNLHRFLGGGKCADVLLWKEKHISMALLVGSTVAWFLFECSGYTFLSLVSNVLLFLIVILFLWAAIASLLCRSPPPIPEILLTEEMVHSLASTLRVEMNKALVAAHDVAIGKDFRVFLKVVITLWLLSKLGAWFDLVTFVYILLVGAHTLPVLYDKYQEEVEGMLKKLLKEAKKQYATVDANVLSKIPRSTTSSGPPQAKKKK